MPTVINNPGNETTGSSSNAVANIIIALIVLAGFILFFVYGLPMIRNSFSQPKSNSIDVNVKMPDNGGQNPAPAQ